MNKAFPRKWESQMVGGAQNGPIWIAGNSSHLEKIRQIWFSGYFGMHPMVIARPLREYIAPLTQALLVYEYRAILTTGSAIPASAPRALASQIATGVHKRCTARCTWTGILGTSIIARFASEAKQQGCDTLHFVDTRFSRERCAPSLARPLRKLRNCFFVYPIFRPVGMMASTGDMLQFKEEERTRRVIDTSEDQTAPNPDYNTCLKVALQQASQPVIDGRPPRARPCALSGGRKRQKIERSPELPSPSGA